MGWDGIAAIVCIETPFIVILETCAVHAVGGLSSWHYPRGGGEVLCYIDWRMCILQLT